ncbi:MAG TPA: class I SAM-dependent methyltransferase [Acidimicrobiales bacterium]|nr:class I SAM-dependent methyltransferase [Acidimicrobiales bacterium]
MTEPPDPGVIWQLINGFGAYWVAVAAVELGVFEALDALPMNGAMLAKTIGCDCDRLGAVCDALVGMKLLDRADDRYLLTSDSDAFLIAGRAGSMRDLLLHSPGPWDNWPALSATIGGSPPPLIVGDDFYQSLVRATFPTQHAVAALVAPTLGAVNRVVDLGAGAGPWTIALLETFPTATAVVNDLPGVLEIARETATANDVAERCEFRPGDYFTVPLPEAAFDVVVLAMSFEAKGGRARRSCCPGLPRSCVPAARFWSPITSSMTIGAAR